MGLVDILYVEFAHNVADQLCLDLEICVSLARLGLAQAQNTSKCSLWAVLFGSKRVSCTCNHTECTTSVNSIVRVHSSKICTFF
jgi:hypothetical protein